MGGNTHTARRLWGCSASVSEPWTFYAFYNTPTQHLRNHGQYACILWCGVTVFAVILGPWTEFIHSLLYFFNQWQLYVSRRWITSLNLKLSGCCSHIYISLCLLWVMCRMQKKHVYTSLNLLLSPIGAFVVCEVFFSVALLFVMSSTTKTREPFEWNTERLIDEHWVYYQR